MCGAQKANPRQREQLTPKFSGEQDQRARGPESSEREGVEREAWRLDSLQVAAEDVPMECSAETPRMWPGSLQR